MTKTKAIYLPLIDMPPVEYDTMLTSMLETRRSVEHCTPQADGAWLNELGWSQ